MTRYITILIFTSLCFVVRAQSVHEVTVAINQSDGCPVALGLDESKSFNVHPNPATFSFTIQSAIKEAAIDLIDLNGRKILNKTMTQGILEVDVTNLPSGIYVLHFHYSEGSEKIKIRIQ